MNNRRPLKPSPQEGSPATRTSDREKAKNGSVAIGLKIRRLREEKGLSQGDIERLTGMLRGYISRVEHGHTVPSLETLERFAGALNVPLYQLFRDPGDRSTELTTPSAEDQSPESQFILRMKGCLRGLRESDRNLLLELARKLANR